MSSNTVGRSARTPAKHQLMTALVGKEVGAASHIGTIECLQWIDLTAGDGLVPDGLRWDRNCSPGILARHARASTKPVIVTMLERQASTYDRLLASLAAELPALGYTGAGSLWSCGNAMIEVVNTSGADVGLRRVDRKVAVLATNDPNAICDWAMRPTFAAEVRARTPWFRSISTMGCNTGGLMRLSREDRDHWFELIAQQRRELPAHHDLLLARIERDCAKWGYLLCEPRRWRQEAEATVRESFAAHGMTVQTAWMRTDPGLFAAIQDYLFLTAQERAE